MDGERARCPRCAAELPSGASWCPRCGLAIARPDQTRSQYDYYAPPPSPMVQKSSLQTAREIIRGIGAVMTLLTLALLAINVGIMIWGSGLVIPEAWDKATSLYVALPWLIKFVVLPGASFVAIYFLFIVAVFFSYLVMLERSRKKLIDELRFRPKEHSSAYMMVTLFMAILTMNTAYYAIIALMGGDASTGGGGSSELWESLYSLLRASVWEEVICRILLIGLPLAAVYWLKRDSKRPAYRYVIGGGFQFGTREKVFLVFSAAIFALAHVFSWDLYKIFPTFVAGLALGYLFLKYGVYASIMLHFLIDYLSFPLELWPSDTTDLALGIFLLVAEIVGLLYLVYYGVRSVELFSDRRIWRWQSKRSIAAYYQPLSSTPYQPAPSSPAAPTNPTFGFVCKDCGSTEASYRDGKFQCSKCGKESN
ncbi:MAG: CPBP family glutamic-type intramembrane protease [Methanomassiliicoccales archaeon]|nr:CPBP family glutamic-type intramembrane protease [Methanomassiliicoccales archaeon]